MTAPGQDGHVCSLEALLHPSRASPDAHQSVFPVTLRRLSGILRQSPTALRLMRFAAAHDVHTGLDTLLEPGSSYFYPMHNRFDLGWQDEAMQQTETGTCRYLVSFTAALRRVWQHHMAQARPAHLPPQDAMRFVRAAEADVAAIVHHVAWELRTAGSVFLWRSLMSGMHADVAALYQRTAGEDPQAPYDGTAVFAAFHQWFTCPERRALADGMALEILDMALMQPDIVRRGADACGDMAALGLLPGGGNYLAGCFFGDPWYDAPPSPRHKAWLDHVTRDMERSLSPILRR